MEKVLIETNEKIQGEHIYLRAITQSDATETYLNWMNDPEINQYLESRFSSQTMESLVQFINGIDRHHNLFLAIILNEGHRHIGNIKLGPINPYHKCGDIGLVIGEKDCWGKGFAREAIELISNYAFKTLNLNKVTAGAYADNIGSVKAFEKAGFQREGLLKSQWLVNGTYQDGVLLGKVAHQANI